MKIEETKKLKYNLCDEIDRISLPDLQEFVVYVLERIPDVFWTRPSSYSNKHIEDEFVEGGLVLHTKRTCTVAEHIITSFFNRNARQAEEGNNLRTACILHDVYKNGPLGDYQEGGAPATDPMHPLYHFEYTNKLLQDFFTEHGRYVDENHKPYSHHLYYTIQKIIKAIEMHMGPRWSPSVITQENWNDNRTNIYDISTWVFFCDYIASRKNIIILPDVPRDPRRDT